MAEPVYFVPEAGALELEPVELDAAASLVVVLGAAELSWVGVVAAVVVVVMAAVVVLAGGAAVEEADDELVDA